MYVNIFLVSYVFLYLSGMKDMSTDFTILEGQVSEKRLKELRVWMSGIRFRCLSQYRYSKFRYFVTLTYENDAQAASASYKDFQNFVKNLRETQYREKGYRLDIKYLVCLEHGSLHDRAHFHALFFTDEPIYLPSTKKSEIDNYYFERNSVWSNIWKFGFVRVDDCRSERAVNYVTKYVIKVKIDEIINGEESICKWSKTLGKCLVDNVLKNKIYYDNNDKCRKFTLSKYRFGKYLFRIPRLFVDWTMSKPSNRIIKDYVRLFGRSWRFYVNSEYTRLFNSRRKQYCCNVLAKTKRELSSRFLGYTRFQRISMLVEEMFSLRRIEFEKFYKRMGIDVSRISEFSSLSHDEQERADLQTQCRTLIFNRLCLGQELPQQVLACSETLSGQKMTPITLTNIIKGKWNWHNIRTNSTLSSGTDRMNITRLKNKLREFVPLGLTPILSLVHPPCPATLLPPSQLLLPI